MIVFGRGARHSRKLMFLWPVQLSVKLRCFAMFDALFCLVKENF